VPSAWERERESEHERLRRRVKEVTREVWLHDIGPEFLRGHMRFDHMLRCTSCDLQARFEKEIAAWHSDFGLGKVLMADDRHIESSCNVRRVLGRPQREPEGVMKRDRGWEMGIGNIVSVARDVCLDGSPCNRMWYRPFQGSTALAESQDGLVWHKPPLDLVTNVTVDWLWEDRFHPTVIVIPKESNLLALGLNHALGDTSTVTHDPPRGYLGGFQCLHQPVEGWTGAWADACGGHSIDGLGWSRFGEGGAVKPQNIRNKRIHLPFGGVDGFRPQASPQVVSTPP